MATTSRGDAGMTVVGGVVSLWRSPVKSMAAGELDGVDVSWHGLAGDRRWAFIRDGQVRSGFPWLTIRERPELARYRPGFTEPGRPDASPTLVRTPSGADLDVADPALAAELGPGVRVIKQNRGVFDTMPLSLLTTQTLAGLRRRRRANGARLTVPRGSIGSAMFHADLHIHSRFSRACSKDCDIEHLSWWALRKGLRVLGTGDFTRPAWAAELRDTLVPAEPGLFRIRPDLEKRLVPDTPAPCPGTP